MQTSVQAREHNTCSERSALLPRQGTACVFPSLGTYLVNMKGTKWPKCSASELGPLPV